MNGERARLLGVFAHRAEKVAAVTHPYRRVTWSQIEDTCRAQRALSARRPPTTKTYGAAPIWMIASAARANLGLGERPNARRLARRRLIDYLSVERAFEKLGEGLRFGELRVLTGVEEHRLYCLLRWAAKQYLLVDQGERGWYRAQL